MLIMEKLFQVALIAFALVLFSPISAQRIQPTPKNNPVELGKVNWLRDYNEAITKAKETGKPVFILFQEVPGCSTCSRFGFGPLSDPFLVEAIEDNFIPLAIHNNKRGKDAEILKKFNEPSWNNPVVRIIDEHGKDIVNRMANGWSASDLLSTVAAGIEQSGNQIPLYLSLRLEEMDGQENTKEVNLAMYCFWTGEKEISKIAGVLSTEAGFMHGNEVVKVTYNANELKLLSLIKQADKVSCADAVYVEDKSVLAELKQSTGISNVKSSGSYRPDREVKYYLSKSDYRFVPMSQIQQAKVNAAIGDRKSPDQYLSPRQIQLKQFISQNKEEKWKSQINQDASGSWFALLDKMLLASSRR